MIVQLTEDGCKAWSDLENIDPDKKNVSKTNHFNFRVAATHFNKMLKSKDSSSTSREIDKHSSRGVLRKSCF